MTDAPMQTINTDQKQRGLRILFLDDGGVRGLSELIILREIMSCLMDLENLSSLPKPCDYFDIIGGTGTGGVIALMLGRLHMPIDLAIKKFVSFSQEVFSDVKTWKFRDEKFKASVFESSIRRMIQCVGFPEDVLMQEDSSLCKSFVMAFSSVNMTLQVFRTYRINATQGDRCTVVQAARATTAMPGFFKPVEINTGGIIEIFTGGSLHYSDSTNFALKEAELVFGLSQPVACLVNIGAGNSDHIFWNSNTSPQTIMTHFTAPNYNLQAENFAKHYVQIPGLFYRLSVHQGFEEIAMDDWKKQEEIQIQSLHYLQESKIKKQLNNLANILYGCPQRITLEALLLKIKIEAFESNYSDTLQAMSDLAAIFWQSGQIDDAEKLEQEVLKVRIQTFGRNHPDTVQAMADVAAIFWQGGKIEEAEKLDKEVLEFRSNTFDESHKATLQAMSNLAATFRKNGKLKEAEELQQKVLSIQEETFGSSHPDTIQAISNLTMTFWQGGKLEEAKRLNQGRLEFIQEIQGVFGSSCLAIIQVMSNLAATHWQSGDFEEAEKLEQEVLRISVAASDSSHPNAIQHDTFFF